MKLYFVTANKHKFEEAVEALKEYSGITLAQINADKPENKDDDLVYSVDPIRLIAEDAARELSEEHNLPVVVEDAGIFFKAYNNFPGLNTKWIMKTIDYKGIFKLLENENRSAYFRSVVSCCLPRNLPVSSILSQISVESRRVSIPACHSSQARCLRYGDFTQKCESIVSFEGRVDGRISNRVVTDDIDCMDYDRIFIPDGYDKEFALMMDIKRQISHRNIAFSQLGHYFSNH